MIEEDAFREFCKLRWPTTGGEPVCPRCGCDRYRKIRTRSCFRCKACNKQYTATSGTIFHCRKLSYATLLEVIRHVGAGTNTNAMAKTMGLQQRSTWYLSQRIKSGDGMI